MSALSLRLAVLLASIWLLCSLPVSAQVSASLSGRVLDQTGAVISGASVTAENLDTAVTRTTITDQAGRYQLLSLPIGRYEIRATKDGFAEEIRTGILLVVGQDATADLNLQVGKVTEQVKVESNVPVVNTSTQDISGLVGEKEDEDAAAERTQLRSAAHAESRHRQLHAEKTGGIGVSNSSTGNNFSVSGNRPQQNLFLLNGVEFTGAAENNMTPGGPSGELLGVDAVREFNVLRDTYGAEYGKQPGRPGGHRHPVGQQPVARLAV